MICARPRSRGSSLTGWTPAILKRRSRASWASQETGCRVTRRFKACRNSFGRDLRAVRFVLFMNSTKPGHAPRRDRAAMRDAGQLYRRTGSATGPGCARARWSCQSPERIACSTTSSRKIRFPPGSSASTQRCERPRSSNRESTAKNSRRFTIEVGSIAGNQGSVSEPSRTACYRSARDAGLPSRSGVG